MIFNQAAKIKVILTFFDKCQDTFVCMFITRTLVCGKQILTYIFIAETGRKMHISADSDVKKNIMKTEISINFHGHWKS